MYIYYCLVCFYLVRYLRKSLFLLPVLSWQTWHGVWDGSRSGCQCGIKDRLLNKEELLDSETQIICSILNHILLMSSINITHTIENATFYTIKKTLSSSIHVNDTTAHLPKKLVIFSMHSLKLIRYFVFVCSQQDNAF